jgi:hypothetical protein
MRYKPKSNDSSVRPLITLALLGACDATPAVPAEGRIASLPAPVATLQGEFTRIGTVRLTVVDFATGLVEPRGGVGDGPGEYRRVGPLMPLPADSSLMLDLRARRWLLLAESEIVTTVPISDSAVAATARGRLIGVASEGKVVAVAYPSRSAGTRSRHADSLIVIRVERSTGQADTVAHASSAEQSATAVRPRTAIPGRLVPTR